MEEKDPTLEGTVSDPTPEKKAGEEQTPQKTDEVDYKAKYLESSKEAIRLKKELEKYNGDKKPEKAEVKPEAEKGDLDEVISRKVKEVVNPYIREQEEKRVDDWLKKNSDAVDYLEKIQENYGNMPGKSVEEKLENALLVAKKDKAKESGKKEMAFSFYQRDQIIASGGAGADSSGETLPILSAEEKRIAKNMKISEEAYAKRKLTK